MKRAADETDDAFRTDPGKNAFIFLGGPAGGKSKLYDDDIVNDVEALKEALDHDIDYAQMHREEMGGQAGDKVDIYEHSEYKCLVWKESPVSMLILKWEVSLLYKGPIMKVGTLLHVTFECIGEEGTTKICTEECTVRCSSDVTDKDQPRLGLSELTVRLSNRPENESTIKFKAKNYKSKEAVTLYRIKTTTAK